MLARPFHLCALKHFNLCLLVDMSSQDSEVSPNLLKRKELKNIKILKNIFILKLFGI